MRDNPFLDFHRRAEAAGYPALLIVSVVSLALVVTPVLLLGLTRAVWVLALALLSLLLAIALLAGAVLAAMSDYSEPAEGRADSGDAADDERNQTVPLPRRDAATRQAGDHRRAA
ncbi:MAG: hypothetical protein ACRDL4_11820 [Thermoleophilaceae bacterium]